MFATVTVFSPSLHISNIVETNKNIIQGLSELSDMILYHHKSQGHLNTGDHGSLCSLYLNFLLVVVFKF